MRLVQQVVAVNFRELFVLEEIVNKILQGLQHAGSHEEASIHFLWTDVLLDIRICSQSSDQRYSYRPLEGVSSYDEARLLSLMVTNHLASGRPFSVKETAGDFDQRHFTMYLKRVA